MLIEFYGENFGCFRDEFRLSMLASDIDPGSDRGIVEVKLRGDDEPLRLVRAVAIYGANGSGKSTVLRAASVLRRLIVRSRMYRSDSPLNSYEPFALGPEGNPVRLGIKGVVNGRVYEYEIRFERTKFVSERLTCRTPDGERLLFHRVGQNVQGEWTKGEGFSLLSKDFRPNALLLSLADRLAPSLAKKIAVGIRRLLTPYSASTVIQPWLPEGVTVAAQRAKDNSRFAAWLLSHLKSADVGVTDLRTELVKVTPPRDSDDAGAHSNEETVEEYYRLSLLHRGSGGSFPIPYARESHGTQRLVELAPLFYDLGRFSQPTAAFVDEIDESLHPLLLQGIVRHFNCEMPLTSIRGQIIFVTHDTSLLEGEAKDAILRRDQVYLTEKDSSGAARLYSVVEFKERNNLNLRRRYLQGRYGAIPSLGTFEE